MNTSPRGWERCTWCPAMRCYSTVFLKMKILRYIPWYTHSGLNDYVKLIDKCAEGCTIDAAHGSCLLPSWVIGNCTFVPDVSSHHWSPDILEHLWFIYMGHMGMSENWEYSWEWQLYREINDDKPSNVRRYIFRQTHIYADFFPHSLPSLEHPFSGQPRPHI